MNAKFEIEKRVNVIVLLLLFDRKKGSKKVHVFIWKSLNSIVVISGNTIFYNPNNIQKFVLSIEALELLRF